MIGITGPIREAVKYDRSYSASRSILLREMLVKRAEAAGKEQKLLDETIRNRYVEEWMKREDTLIQPGDS